MTMTAGESSHERMVVLRVKPEGFVREDDEEDSGIDGEAPGPEEEEEEGRELDGNKSEELHESVECPHCSDV